MVLSIQQAQERIWEKLQPIDCDPCPHCHGLGYITLDGLKWDHPLFGVAFRCICQKRQVIDQKSRFALKGTEQSIPQAAYNYDFEHFTKLSHAAEAAKACWAMVLGDSKPGLVLWGGTGTGKTTLGLITLRYLNESGQSVAWCDYTDIIKRVQATYNKKEYDGPSEDEILGALTEADLLVIDDMGSVATNNPVSENRTEIMFRVINARYARQAKMIITSNCTPDKLKYQFGDRIWSRVNGMSEIVKCDGKDLRTS